MNEEMNEEHKVPCRSSGWTKISVQNQSEEGSTSVDVHDSSWQFMTPVHDSLHSFSQTHIVL